MQTNQQIQEKLKAQYPHSTREIESIDFLPFSHLEGSVKDDVKFLRNHPLVPNDSVITGWVYEVETGKVRPDFASLYVY